MEFENLISKIKFGSDGLIPAVAQDISDGKILMVAYMNKESLAATLKSGKATYWSRSRKKLWLKGETSGHFQIVKEILVDCDADCLVLKIEQIGGVACHTGNRSCFFRKIDVKVNPDDFIPLEK